MGRMAHSRRSLGRSLQRHVPNAHDLASSPLLHVLLVLVMLGIVLSSNTLAVTAQQHPPAATASSKRTPYLFPRPDDRFGENHKFGIMLGLIVSVGLFVISGVTAFALCCADDDRRRRRLRRQWAAGNHAPPPGFHLISPRWRRRIRRWRRRHGWRQVAGSAEEGGAQGDSDSDLSSSSSDPDLSDDEVAAAGRREVDGRHVSSFSARLARHASAVSPPEYSETPEPPPYRRSRGNEYISLRGQDLTVEEETSFSTIDPSGGEGERDHGAMPSADTPAGGSVAEEQEEEEEEGSGPCALASSTGDASVTDPTASCVVERAETVKMVLRSGKRVSSS